MRLHMGDLRRLRVLLNEVATYVTRNHPDLRADCYRFLMGTCVKRLKMPFDVRNHHVRTYFTVCAKNWSIITLHNQKRNR